MHKNSYTYAEVEKILASGNIKGRLSRDDLPTPALLLDLDAFEWNVARMARYMKEQKRALRPSRVFWASCCRRSLRLVRE